MSLWDTFRTDANTHYNLMNLPVSIVVWTVADRVVVVVAAVADVGALTSYYLPCSSLQHDIHISKQSISISSTQRRFSTVT